MSRTLSRQPDERINWVTSLPFLLAHAVLLLVLVTGVTGEALRIAVVLYAVRMFGVTAGYHRYFSHRSYRTNRVFQFLLALLGTTAAQKGPLWWAAHHRAHHRFSDTEEDIHSPQKGFWWSHAGWILCDRYAATDLSMVSDLARFPELRLIERYNFIGPWALGVATYLAGGWSGLVVGFFGSTVVLWHATFTVNSLNHTFGTRRYATSDTSRNNLLLALLTFGEGWHNNHHHYQVSARQGFFWWEIDLSWYGLRVLQALHLVGGLRTPSPTTRAAGRLSEGEFDLGMFRAGWRRAGVAVARSRSAMGPATRSAGDRVSAGRAAIDAALQSKRERLDELVQGAQQAAEDLARATKRARRGFGPVPD